MNIDSKYKDNSKAIVHRYEHERLNGIFKRLISNMVVLRHPIIVNFAAWYSSDTSSSSSLLSSPSMCSCDASLPSLRIASC